MDRHVELKKFPDGLSFPAELADRIGYDAVRQRLWFRGFMCKADFDRLSRLHDDWGYKRALEDLFRICVLEAPGRSPNRLAAIFGRLVAGRDGPGA